MLRFNIKMFDINVCVNLMKMNDFFKKYSLNTILHILMQCANKLIIMIIILKST